MTQEDKELLLKDLSSRLPYGVKCFHPYGIGELKSITRAEYVIDVTFKTPDDNYYDIGEVKPYLRSLSSMTEEEFYKLEEYSGLIYDQLNLASFQNGTYRCLDFYLTEIPADVVILVFDWLNKHHFDYRGLIERDLALEAPEGMYKTE